MDRFVYIHGFNSSARSLSGQKLSDLLNAKVICPEYDYARPFSECMASIRRQIVEAVDENNDRICVMGSSLGGFYALQLRLPSIMHVVAWNPVVFPALQLAQFLGRNTRFSDGQEWEFTRSIMLSYAQSPDPRPWRNEMWFREERRERGMTNDASCERIDHERAFSSCAGERTAMSAGASVLQDGPDVPRRDIFLGDSDDVLDADLTRAFWQHSAVLHDIVSGHQIVDYSHAEALLKKGKLLNDFSDWKAGEEWCVPFLKGGAFSMAAFFEPGEDMENVCRLLSVAEADYLELHGEKNGTPRDFLGVFFYPRHEARMKRLIAGLVRHGGKKRYLLLRADGRVLRHQVASNYLMDSEVHARPSERNVAAFLRNAFPGWQGKTLEWRERRKTSSFNQAVARSHFAALWSREVDPVEAFERSVHAADGQEGRRN